MDRRVYGVETEFGLTHRPETGRGLPPDELARYLFRPVVDFGRSSNIFIPNGSRLYLDVGSHPEYATAECDDLIDLIASDRAGERVMHDLAMAAQERIHQDGFTGAVYVLKNNVDSAGNSYGSHENYLIPRTTHFRRLSGILLPFLVTRQIIAGAGRVVQEDDTYEAHFAFSQRADHMWEGISSATTRSRPIINTRDEPHADAASHRRLHVIVGDSNMSTTTSLLRYGSTDLVLRMIEAGVPIEDFELENPIAAIRAISHDISGQARVRTRTGEQVTAINIQREILRRVTRFVSERGAHHSHVDQILELWDRTLQAVETGEHQLIDQEIDWAIKKRLVEEVSHQRRLDLNHPRLQQIDMAYHDVHPDRGLYHLLVRRGRAATIVSGAQVTHAMTTPPPTRAALRGEFLSTARAYGAECTVDWVHHKLTDRPLEAIMVKDPFAAKDQRVEALLDKLGDRSSELQERSLEERSRQGATLALTDKYTRAPGTQVPEPPLI
ncbi:Pup--protein ligase [Nesterenkonia sphaerica]|uniref:Pup--protein ligase n=1 Tax=Nesterenkonia sphaerica TaxID=1804988 RepID=A0A5R9A3D1_9MICC|nr:Pup--protein ligase [Nesterenkonia sphaerica]TLP73193.1 Pup--protein ligase [Nesterenkonia sphaerica]